MTRVGKELLRAALEAQIMAPQIARAVAAERERCASIAEAMGCDAVAKAIRNPSKTG